MSLDYLVEHLRNPVATHLDQPCQLKDKIVQTMMPLNVWASRL